MKRSRRSSGLFAALLVGLVLPVGLLFAFFSLAPYEAMTGAWPLRISSNEVAFFQRIFDRRPGQQVQGLAERYDLDGSLMRAMPIGARWKKQVFKAEGYTDTVKVRSLVNVEGAFVLDFPSDRLFRTQRSMVLVPASIRSVQAKYAQLVAGSLGGPVPETGFVRLFAAGHDAGLFMKEERITDEFMERHGLADLTLVEQGFGRDRPDAALPEVKGDQQLRAAVLRAVEAVGSGNVERLDTSAAAVLMLLMYAQGNTHVPEEGLFGFARSTGRLSPLYRTPRMEQGRGEAAPILGNDLAACLTSDVVRTQALTIAKELLADSARWNERFIAVDALWAPALAEGRSIGFLQARLADQRATFLARLFHPHFDVFFSKASELSNTTAVHQRADTLDPWLRPLLVGDTIRFTRNKYVIDHDVFVPKGLPVVMEKGARITMAGGKSLVVNGPLFVRGTGLNPVFIRPMDEAFPFGTICVNGNGTTRCEVRGLRMSGGSQAWVDGLYHSGMFSAHDCHVVMEKCVISGAHGEDAVNLKRCRVDVRDCDLSDAKDDLLDLDYVKGTVEGCRFSATRDTSMDANGDGLDLSGSRLLVRECTFDALRDKGMSVGEASQVFIEACLFKHDHLGIAVKDLSLAYVDGSEFTDDAIAFGVYQKKPVFGGGHLFLFNNTLGQNAKEQEVDRFSTVTTGTSPDPKVLQAFGLVGR